MDHSMHAKVLFPELFSLDYERTLYQHYYEGHASMDMIDVIDKSSLYNNHFQTPRFAIKTI